MFADVKLDRRHADIIRQHLNYLTDVIDMQGSLIDNLVAEHVLDSREVELIKSKSTSYDQNSALLKMLRIKSPLDFELFLSALDQSNQHHVADIFRVHTSRSGENNVFFTSKRLKIICLCLYACVFMFVSICTYVFLNVRDCGFFSLEVMSMIY